jgi:hypothetical protein
MNRLWRSGLESPDSEWGLIVDSAHYGHEPLEYIREATRNLLTSWATRVCTEKFVGHPAWMFMWIWYPLLSFTEPVGVAVTLYLRIRSVIDSKLGRDTDCPRWMFPSFPLVPSCKWLDSVSNRPWLHLPNPFQFIINRPNGSRFEIRATERIPHWRSIYVACVYNTRFEGGWEQGTEGMFGPSGGGK